ncbi:carboxymuconolactone decarboxylase family protein [Cellulosimicrobium sp. SH8]|uniref:carboxymuconolactone decarboxylase family protein n=1 Tax=Cellulosimicrobium sp. SH8 TaxID=2952936 RepID=UPI0021F3929F|nr:carboxymuconolactone decarboxylase family protein [Cellulosimicrobium sp. SH8]
MDHAEVLRRLAVNDESVVDGGATGDDALSGRDRALVRIAAAVAVGASVPTYGAEIDGAVEAGVDAAEVVGVLMAVVPVVGLPTVVAAAPRVALALGLEPVEGWDDAAEPGVPGDFPRSG